MDMTHGIRGVPILTSMRKGVLLLTLLALVLPVVAAGAARANEGSLSVQDGRGEVTVRARGGAIGRLERGTITIFDLTPGDQNEPVVKGDDRPLKFIGENGIQYAGAGLRFRIAGGGFRIVIEGRGIDLSVVGRGVGTIRGETLSPGLYSLDGSDCLETPEACEPLPDVLKRFQLVAPERGKKNAVRPAGG